MAIGPGGTQVVTVSDDGLRLWDAASGLGSGRLVRSSQGGLWSVALGPRGRRVASGGTDGTVRFWDSTRRVWVGAESAEQHRDIVLSLTFSSDGTRVLSGGRDGVVRLWDAEDGRPIGPPLVGHVGWINAVAFSPDGALLASAGSDNTLRLWHPADGEVRRAPCASVMGSLLRWVRQDVIALQCGDRLAVFDETLERRGELLLVDDGVVAIGAQRGVYASPSLLEVQVLSFEGVENVGVGDVIAGAEMREALFDEVSVWRDVLEIIEDAGGQVRDFHEWLEGWAYIVWPALAFLLGVIVAFTIWVFWPARMAAWRMQAAIERPGFSWRARPWDHVLGFVLFLDFLASTRRALEAWLRQNRDLLVRQCFTGRVEVDDRRHYYLVVGQQGEVAEFRDNMRGDGRGLLWIDGVSGSGKSALGMYMLREMLTAAPSSLPVLVNENWDGSLAAQVARQLRHPNRRTGPSVEMVRVLGAHGLVCPLVDSLSERGMDDAVERVGHAIANHDFKHVIVTSQEAAPGGQTWQGVKRITVGPLTERDVRGFVEVYVSEVELGRVEREIRDSVGKGQMPSPLFLRFAIEQAKDGKLERRDRLSLVLTYLERLRAGKIDVGMSTMERAASIAAVEMVEDRLRPQEISAERLEYALKNESRALEFWNRKGDREMRPAQLVQVLVQSGLVTRSTKALQFAYDPVAEYLAAWRVKEDPGGNLGVLRRRIEEDSESGLGRGLSGCSSVLPDKCLYIMGRPVPPSSGGRDAMARPISVLEVTPEEKRELARRVAASTTSARDCLRAHIVLLRSEGVGHSRKWRRGWA